MSMSSTDPCTMTIAGFDPSGGAGLLADIKTFEQLDVYGFGVMTANTLQDEERVRKVDWFPVKSILEQMDVLFNKYRIRYFKIGIVENSKMFTTIKEHVMAYDAEACIIWDPVLKSSSGYSFFENNMKLEKLLQHVFMVTPNLPEFNTLFKSEEDALAYSELCNIYLKGGHSEKAQGVDYLYNEREKTSFSADIPVVYPKHGSGCVLSSAITASLAMGHNLHDACRMGKNYTERFLSSHHSLLGWHNKISL